MTDASPHLVTVVIPCLDEEMAIEGCLRSVLAQDHRDLQVIVVDGGSADATVDIIRAIAAEDVRVELLHNPRQIVPTALNIALDAARAEWLVRIDAHATVPSDYVRRVVAHLADGSWGGVGGRKDGVGRTSQGRAVAAAMASRVGVGGSAYHHATEPMVVEHIPFGAYPTALVRELGGWDESLAVNQDFEFDHRVVAAGHRLLLDPELVIDWECRQTVAALFRQYRRYGRGKVDVMRRHPSSVLPRHLLPPALVLGLAGSALLAPRNPRLGLVGWLAYGAVLTAGGVDAARDLEGEDRAWVVPALAAMHVGWGLGALEGWLRHARAALSDEDPTLGAQRERRRQANA